MGLVQRDKWHEYFFSVARETAKLSHGIRLKTGAVAVRDKRIVCCGFNGTAPGRPNECESREERYYDNPDHAQVMIDDGWLLDPDKNCTVYKLVTKEEVLHAETNLISYAARHGISLEGCSLYITHSPCPTCASLILASGISKVYYEDEYRRTDGIEYLKSSGITIIKKE